MELLYAIVNSGDVNGLNFKHFDQTSAKTVRKSLDGTKAIVSFLGIRTPQPASVTVNTQIITDRDTILSLLERAEKYEGRYKTRYYKRRFDKETKTLIERIFILNKQKFEIKVITRTTQFPENVDSDFNTWDIKRDDSGNIISSGIAYAKDRSIGIIETGVYTKDEIKEIVTGAQWSIKEPRAEYFSPQPATDGNVVTVHGTSLYDITGVEINGVQTPAINPNPETVRFQTPVKVGDGKLILLNRYEIYNTNLDFQYIYDIPSISDATIRFVAQRGTFGLIVNGGRLDNVVFVVLEPTINQDNHIQVHKKDFVIRNQGRIAIDVPDKIVETYNLKLIDIEGREIPYATPLDKVTQ